MRVARNAGAFTIVIFTWYVVAGTTVPALGAVCGRVWGSGSLSQRTRTSVPVRASMPLLNWRSAHARAASSIDVHETFSRHSGGVGDQTIQVGITASAPA